MDAVQEKLNNASTGGSTAQVLTLLKDNPDLDVNWADDLDQWTALHLASLLDRAERPVMNPLPFRLVVNVATCLLCVCC